MTARMDFPVIVIVSSQKEIRRFVFAEDMLSGQIAAIFHKLIQYGLFQSKTD